MSDEVSYAKVPSKEASLMPNVEAAVASCLEVTAPADLPEGYSFSVQVNGEDTTVVVPPGGVTAGQRFLASVENKASMNKMEVPVGHWRKGLCDCCSMGFFHPLWWMSFCCGLIPLGQVLTRLNLDACGQERGSNHHGPSTFRVTFLIFVTWFVTLRSLTIAFHIMAPDVPQLTSASEYLSPPALTSDTNNFISALDLWTSVIMVVYLVAMGVWHRGFLEGPKSFKPIILFVGSIYFLSSIAAFFIGMRSGFEAANAGGVPSAQQAFGEPIPVPESAQAVASVATFLNYAFAIYLMIVVFRTRRAIRKKYAIESDECGDCCVSVFCKCCAIAQMSYHTADYNKYPMDYGSETGLEESAPALLDV